MNRTVGKVVVGCALVVSVVCQASAGQQLTLIPWPRSVKADGGQLVVTEKARIVTADKSLAPLAAILSKDIWRLTAQRLKVAEGEAGAGDISLALSTELKGEAYAVAITDRVVVRGGTYQAGAWGEVTLLQLFRNGGTLSLPRVTIQDQPDAPYRGVMLDLARRWHPLDTLKDTVELLRLYKIGYLHLHLSDNESFVFPCKAFPELPTPGRSYSREEMTDLVRFADERGVTIIPEIDVPGHAGSWIGKRAEIFGTLDPATGKAKRTGVLNMASEKAYEGMDTLVGELCEMFKSSPYIHLGTDETSADGLKHLPEYATYVAKHGLKDAAAGKAHELMAHFIVRMDEIVRKHGRQMITWDAPSGTPNVKMPTDIIAMAWSGSPETGLKAGFKTINACWVPLYIVPTQGRAFPPEAFYEWNSHRFNQYGWRQPMQLPADEKNIIGAQICFWEERYNEVIPLLRPRLPALSERLWNPEAGKTFADFQARFAPVDRLVQNILYPVTIAADGLVEPDDVHFTDKLRVNLTSALPGTIHYTLSKPWEVLPSASSNAYSGPITLDDTMTVSARLFNPAGKAVGGITQERYSKIVPGYRYRLLGPTPTDGWREMPDFSKLTVLRAGVMGLMTPDRAEQINRSMFAGLPPFGHIDVRIHGLYNPRTLELNGQLRIPADGDYEFKVRTATGRAELAFGDAAIGACIADGKERITRGLLKAGVYPFTIKYYNRGVFNDLNIQFKGPADASFVPFETLVLPIARWQKPSPLATLPASACFEAPAEPGKLLIKPNLATHKPVTVGPDPRVRDEDAPPEYAVDGQADDPYKHWNSVVAAPQWLQVDLQQVHPINFINVITYWDGSRYYQFNAEVSLDGRTWKKVLDFSHNTRPATSQGYSGKFPTTEARYVRINMLKNSANPFVHIVELVVDKVT